MNPDIRMVDVSEKAVTERIARSRAVVQLNPSTFQSIRDGKIPKGDVLSTAKIAGIQAAKETARILPLCHPVPLESVEIDFKLKEDTSQIEILATTKASWKTGVEMESLAAVSAAALTIYDMCKALERGIQILQIELLEKSGGKSGKWSRL